MLTLIAWRNVWRNRIRSLVVIMSIAIGLAAGVFVMAFSWGMYDQRIEQVIENQLSHIQIHHPQFKDQREVKYTISDGHKILENVRQDKRVKAAAGRVLLSGMASSPKTGAGVFMYGINPEDESAIIELDKSVEEGKYFEGVSRNPVLIGDDLADKLKVKVRSKIVLTFQDATGQITAGAFRVVGIYDTGNSSLDEMNIYVQQSDVHRLLADGEKLNEIAILLHNNDSVSTVTQELKNKHPEMAVESWRELSPELDLIIGTFNQYMYIFIGIILLALTFGIVNTMLMAVLERVRELGMLMAIGMNKKRLFFMIVLETVFLSLIGGPLGMLIAYAAVQITGDVGIDLSMFAKAWENYGFSSMVYPNLDFQYYINIALMAVGAAILSSLYPAYKALQLKPAEAIRKI